MEKCYILRYNLDLEDGSFIIGCIDFIFFNEEEAEKRCKYLKENNPSTLFYIEKANFKKFEN